MSGLTHHKMENSDMVIYFSSFFISVLLLFMAEKKYFSNKFLTIIALIIPILLAGLRKEGIGTDTEVYANVLYQAAKEANDFFDYLGKNVYSSFQNKPVSNWEIGYNLLVYVSVKLTGSFQGILFFTHFFIIFLIYKGLKDFKGYFWTFWAILIFYFMFYGSSLNIMRQWLAIAIIFYGTHYLQQNKDERFIAMVLIAMLFHNSAFIGMIIWLVYKYLQAGDVKKKLLINGKVIDNDIIKILMILLTGIIALLGLSVIANFLGSINSVFARYVRLYISGTVHLMPMQVLRRLPLLLLMVINWRRLRVTSPSVPFLYCMTILDLIASQLGGITAQSSRIGYYFSIYEIILLAELTYVQKGKKRILYYILIAIYSIAVFYYDNILMGRAEIVPYLFYFN